MSLSGGVEVERMMGGQVMISGVSWGWDLRTRVRVRVRARLKWRRGKKLTVVGWAWRETRGGGVIRCEGGGIARV